MKAATAVTNADYLPIQERSETAQIIPFPPLGTFSIFCDGVLHTRMRGTRFTARNRFIALSNSRPEHYWSVE